MRKSAKKLVLAKETVRRLDEARIDQAVGGLMFYPTDNSAGTRCDICEARSRVSPC